MYRAQHFYCPPAKLRESNVFSHMCLSVCLFTGGGACVTITHDTLDFTIPYLYKAPYTGPTPCTGPFTPEKPHPIPLYRPSLVTSCGQDWRPVQLCSLKEPHPTTSADICWLATEACMVGKRYASCWNAVFCLVNLTVSFSIGNYERWRVRNGAYQESTTCYKILDGIIQNSRLCHGIWQSSTVNLIKLISS